MRKDDLQHEENRHRVTLIWMDVCTNADTETASLIEMSAKMKRNFSSENVEEKENGFM